MRLLNAKTLVLEEYFEHNTPDYAILSHRWRNGEVSFQDIKGPPPTHKAGYEKIRQTCLQALQDGLTHAWVDTCCIDKSSSAELSESINSMYRWYHNAVVCYAYLDDVDLLLDENDQTSALVSSEWFSRGWTLQELLAPPKLVFYSSDWSPINSRDAFLDAIEERTGIDRQFLTFLDQKEGHHIHDASISERMSWASSRKTTRSEDVAYCMLGIFGVAMPLLYGEGKAAFLRLQEELIKHSDDQTILAWDMPLGGEKEIPFNADAPDRDACMGVLATSPAAFAGSGNLIPRRGNHSATTFAVTNQGLTIEAPFGMASKRVWSLMLLCGPKDEPTAMVALQLSPVQVNQYARCMEQPSIIGYNQWSRWEARPVHLMVRPAPPARDHGFKDGGIWIRRIPDGLQFGDGSPRGRWSPRHRILDVSVNRGILNATEVAPSFSLRPLAGVNGLSGVRVSLKPMALPWFITWAFGISPFHTRYAPLSTPDAGGNTHPTDQPTAVSQRVSRASYMHLADGSLLYATTNQHTILGKQFLVADIKIARGFSMKTWVLIQHFCVDCLTILFSFPFNSTVAAICLYLVNKALFMGPAALVYATINVQHTFLGSADEDPWWYAPLTQSLWSVYSVISKPAQMINHFDLVLFSMISYSFPVVFRIHMLPEFNVRLIRTWIVTVCLLEWIPWPLLFCIPMWSMTTLYLILWVIDPGGGFYFDPSLHSRHPWPYHADSLNHWHLVIDFLDRWDYVIVTYAFFDRFCFPVDWRVENVLTIILARWK